MRKLLLIAGGVIGVAILIIAVLFGYAVLNLNSIIASNRARILASAGDAIGRSVEANEIKASLGWGVAIDVTGVKLADDPAFSQLPFVQASDVYLKVEFVPLLHKEVRVTELVLRQPQIRVIRNAAGVMNFSTIAKKAGAGAAGGKLAQPEAAAESAKGGGAAAMGGVSIKAFSVNDGRIFYEDKQAGGAPVTVSALNLKVDNFSFASPFDVALQLAAFGERKNLELRGKAGPIMKDGGIDAGAIPLDLNATVGPVTLAQLKAVPALAKALPPSLALSDEVNLQAKASGTVDAIDFDAASDLTSNHVAYAPTFDKPAGVALKFAVSGSRKAGKLVVRQANLKLADLDAKLTDIVLESGNIKARVDTNKFDLGPLAKLISAAQPYNPSGVAEIHTGVSVANKKPSLNGTVTLANVNASVPGGKTPPVGNLNGTIRLAGNSANLGPLTFNLGSGHAQLQAAADSIQPVRATYRLSVDKITVAELVPTRKDVGDENLTQVSANGSVSNEGGAFSASTKLNAASGMLANVVFNLLALDANYGRDRLNLNSLKLGAFDGSIGASGVATLGAAPGFDLKVDTQNVNMQKALESQQSKAANTIRGLLTANVQIAGQGKGFDQIKPTLRGAGRGKIDNGKLIGVNVVAQALNKVDNVPGIGALVPASVVANHPALFKSPDTDIQEAGLTFQILGPRITSHDLVVRSPDYSIFGDGWFDLDKNIDLAAKITMSKPFSNELIAAKKNVSYLTNSAGEVEIPLRVTGQLPHPAVLPDAATIAQRAATHAVQKKIGTLLEKKGLGGLLGGGAGGGAGAGATPSATGGGGAGGLISPLKGLFH